jgi:predicted P-loop ATPase
MTAATVTNIDRLAMVMRYAKERAPSWYLFPLHYMKDGQCSCGQPCGRQAKHPRTQHGHKDATKDISAIKNWWTRDSHSNVGLATGPSRLIVIDVDPRNDGDHGLLELEKEHGPLPPTLTSNTGGGGQHYIYRVPDGIERVKSRVLKSGVELKADGGYIVIPPSNHVSGGEYVWDSGQPEEPTIAPFWMCEAPKRAVLSDRPVLEGILGAAFIAAGMAGPPLGPDKIAVTCPWEAEHSIGKRHDGSTLVFAPTMSKWGYFYCAHSHCQARLADRSQRNSLVMAALPPDAVEAAKSAVKGSDKELARIVREPWEQSLRWNKSGEMAPDAGNLALMIRNSEDWGGCVSYDESRDKIYWAKTPPDVPGLRQPKKGDEVSEHSYIHVSTWFGLRKNTVFKKEVVQDVMVGMAIQNKHNSLQEHLAGLQWDGVARLDTWLSEYMGAKDDEYTRFVGAAWLISAMARAYVPGCQVDHTLVLESQQGTGKSSAFQILGRDWYLGSLPRIEDKDARHILVASWICEIQELAAFRGVESQKIKAFLTDRTDKYRPAYARFFVARPRGCVFAASTNEGDYIQDTTGARRFWPVKVGTVRRAELERDRDALLAEARDAYHAGRQWHSLPSANISHKITEQQEERQAIHPWEDAVISFCKARRAMNPDGVLLSEIIKSLNISIDRQTPRDSQVIGAILRKHGWERARSAFDKSVRLWRPVGLLEPTWPEEV